MLNICVMVSGGGTNLQALIDSIERGEISNGRISLVISNRKSAFALERARLKNIPALFLPKKDMQADEYDRLTMSHMEKHDIGLVVMAGFTFVMGSAFIERYRNRIINVHPSLIPSFCGKGYYGLVPHERALEYGVKISGATVHIVDNGTDEGPIILQKAVPVMEEDTPETLQKRVMEQAEWVLLPQAVSLFAQNRVRVEGRKVKII